VVTVTTRRRKHRAKAAFDDLVPINGVRLKAAIEHAGRTVNGLAQQLQKRGVTGASQSTLDYITRGRHKRCRASVRDDLARLLRVPRQWLAGEWGMLPGAGLLLAIRGRLIAMRAGDRKRERRQRELAMLRGDVTALLETLSGTWEFPPRVGDSPPSWIELGNHLEQLRGILASRIPTSQECGQSLDVVDQYLRRHPAEERRRGIDKIPARAQLAEYRLKEMCWRAWRRDAQAAYPGVDPLGTPEGERYEMRGGATVLKEPWGTLATVLRAVETLLAPEAWRAHLFTNWHDGEAPDLKPAEWHGLTPAVAQALEHVLEPWFSGRARLNVNRLSGLIPHPWQPTVL